MKKMILLFMLLMLVAALPAAVLAQDDALAEAQELLDEGEFEDAVEAFTEILDEDNSNVDALIGRSEAYALLGEGRSALADARRAVTLAPNNAEAYIARGYATIVDDPQSIDDALADFAEATRVDPENPEPYIEQAAVYAALGQTSQAFSNYDAAIELDPENPDYLYSRGLLYYNTGDLDAALEDYDAAIELDPENPDYYFSRSYVHFDMGDLEATIADDDRVIELAPDFASGYLNRGFHYWSNGDNEEAAVDYYDWLTLIETSRFDLDELEGTGDTLELEMDEGWSYYIPFTAPDSGSLSIEVFSPGGLVDPVVVILNDDNVPIYVDDDGGFGLSVDTEEYILGEGDYTIVIGHAGGGSVGRIQAEIEIGVTFGDV